MGKPPVQPPCTTSATHRTAQHTHGLVLGGRWRGVTSRGASRGVSCFRDTWHGSEQQTERSMHSFLPARTHGALAMHGPRCRALLYTSMHAQLSTFVARCTNSCIHLYHHPLACTFALHATHHIGDGSDDTHSLQTYRVCGFSVDLVHVGSVSFHCPQSWPPVTAGAMQPAVTLKAGKGWAGMRVWTGRVLKMPCSTYYAMHLAALAERLRMSPAHARQGQNRSALLTGLPLISMVTTA